MMKTRYCVVCAVFLFMFFSQSAFSHCDSLEGPVVKDARQALEKGDVTPVLKWVSQEDESDVRQAFNAALAERKKDPGAQQAADKKFFETVVRIHREGEGAPFSGLKQDALVDPTITAADQALESGSTQELSKILTDRMAEGLNTRFKKAMEDKAQKDKSVDAGREYVESYQEFIHFVEDLSLIIQGKVSHVEAQDLEEEEND